MQAAEKTQTVILRPHLGQRTPVVYTVWQSQRTAGVFRGSLNAVLPSAIRRILFRFMVTTTGIAVQVC
jgi:hypothetical protein